MSIDDRLAAVSDRVAAIYVRVVAIDVCVAAINDRADQSMIVLLLVQLMNVKLVFNIDDNDGCLE